MDNGVTDCDKKEVEEEDEEEGENGGKEGEKEGDVVELWGDTCEETGGDMWGEMGGEKVEIKAFDEWWTVEDEEDETNKVGRTLCPI